MRPIPLLAGLLAAGLLATTEASAELVLSAPPQVVAGSGSTLLMRFAGVGDLDPSTGPVATVDGNSIRIDLNDECSDISCDIMEERLFRVDLPPLDAGEYDVLVYSASGSDLERGSFALSVAADVEADSSTVLPAEGFWKPVGMSGTGLHIQHRGELLAVSQFDQAGDDAPWRLDAVPLQGRSAIVLLRDYSGGSCFGCDPYAPPTASDGGMAMRIDFDSARTATAMLVDGTEVPLVNMAFGAEYVDVELAPDDATFGSLALPDLAGKWAVKGPVSSEGIVTLVATADPEAGTAEFTSTEGGLRIECVPASDGQAAGCFLSDTQPSPPLLRVAFAPLGDVTEQRLVFDSSLAGQEPLFAVRIPASGPEDAMPPLPAEGFWTIPGQSGTGMHFQHRGELLAVSQFDFVDRASHWRLGVAPLDGGSAEVDLHSYSGGSCFGCTPHVEPEADSNPPVATISFDSARRATVDLGGASVIPLVNLPFGADYIDVALPGGGDGQFGPLALPDLSGTWAFDLHDDVPGPRIVTLEVQYIVLTSPPPGSPAQMFTGFARDPADGERFELICEPGNEVAPAGCELRIGDFAIGTPPPGWYPFARLGDIEEDRIRFVGGPGTEDGGFRVFYAVRIP